MVKVIPPTSGAAPILVLTLGRVVTVVFAIIPLLIVLMAVISAHNLPVVRVITTVRIILVMEVVC